MGLGQGLGIKGSRIRVWDGVGAKVWDKGLGWTWVNGSGIRVWDWVRGLAGIRVCNGLRANWYGIEVGFFG